MIKKILTLTIMLASISVGASITKSNLGAFNTALVDSSSALPYDAEVEYIDSIVPAFIDTGIYPNNSTIVEIDGLFLSAGANSLGTMMGCNNDRYMFRYRTTTRAELAMVKRGNGVGNGSWCYFETDIKTRHLYTYGGNFGVLLDGEQIDDGIVFANYTYTLKIAGGYNSTNSQRGGNCRYWRVSIWKNNELVRDFQPVRITNEYSEIEGAMYDRVSGKLFRNAGTGRFIIGPDI